MKTLSISFLFFALIVVSSCNKTISKENKNGVINDEFTEAYNKALESPIIETKLFGGFRFGMTPQQVDSVFKIWVKERKVVKFDEAGKRFGTIDQYLIEPKIGSYAYRYDVGLPYTLDIQFYPEYLDGELVTLFCSVKTPEENMNPKEVYKFLADEFEKSERGKSFQKFSLDFDGEPSIIFIKDNIEINFFPQPNLDESSIQYNNVPLMKQYREQEDAKRAPAREL